ncbi:MAG: helix-turn-helix domain-containing protein [Granulosicoccus sp.]
MTQSAKLVSTIKKELKSQRLSYRDVASALQLSESAVKQMFANGNFSLKKLDQLCELLSLDFTDLARMSSGQKGLDSLDVEQEERLISDPVLLIVAYCVINHWSFYNILRRFKITETECIQKLAELDRMGIAELLPGNRIRPRISLNFQWQPNGPIDRYFRSEVQGQFFDSSFNEPGELRLVKSGDISAATFTQITQRLETVGQQFDDLARADHLLPSENRLGVSMVLAIRHWQFSAFKHLERETGKS